jgi:hypothetical protein
VQTRDKPSRYQPRIPITLEVVKKALTNLKPGTSHGPFCDFTDTIKAFGLSSPDQSNNTKHLRILTKFLALILNNETPQSSSNTWLIVTSLPFARTKTIQTNFDRLVSALSGDI